MIAALAALALSGCDQDSGPANPGPDADADADADGDVPADVAADADGDIPTDVAADPGGDVPTVVPTVRAAATYEVTRSTHAYAQGLVHDDWSGSATGTVDLLLNLYEPTDAPPGRPALIAIHGGGFTGGSRGDPNMSGFAQYFAERGWVAMSIDYRLAGDHGTVAADWASFVALFVPADRQNQAYALYPAARDAKAAVRWLNANADSYQVNTDYVTTLGGSAGSYLAITLGVTDPEDFRDELSTTEDSTLASTNLTEDSEVHTIIDHWGGISHMEILEALDGISRFDSTDAPVSIVHGTADPTVPFTEAEKLRDAYIETGAAYAFHPLDGAGHAAWSETVEGLTLRELAFEFVVDQQGLVVEP